MDRKPQFEYDRPFQAKMVKTFFADKDFQLTIASHIDPDLFENKIHRWVVRTVARFVQSHGTPMRKDALINYHRRALKAKIFRGEDRELSRSFISKIDRPVVDRDYVKEEFYNFVKHQDTKVRILDLLDALEKHQWEDIDKLFAEGQTIQNIGMGSLGHFYVRDRKQRLQRRRLPLQRGIPTGIPNLDQHFKYKGVPRKTINTVIAPQGRGKTASLVHIGKNAIIAGNKVLHVSINEMSEENMQDRYDAALSLVDLNDLENKRYRKRIWKRADEIGRQFGECLVIKEFDSVTVAGIEACIKLLASTSGFVPDVVIIDYADLITPSKFYDSTYEEAGLTYRELRALAKRHNLVVWTASQTTREALTKPIITMADLAESIKKANVADLMIALCQTKKEKLKRRARWFVAKSRYGLSEFELAPCRVNWARQAMMAA
jgi:replicative DNA helicase